MLTDDQIRKYAEMADDLETHPMDSPKAFLPGRAHGAKAIRELLAEIGRLKGERDRLFVVAIDAKKDAEYYSTREPFPMEEAIVWALKAVAGDEESPMTTHEEAVVHGALAEYDRGRSTTP